MAKEKPQRNRIYQVYELRDSIQSAIINLDLVQKQQGHLVELVMASKYSEELKQFTTELVAQSKEFDSKRLLLNERLEKVNYIIAIYEKKDAESELVTKVISKLLEALGLDKPEPEAKA